MLNCEFVSVFISESSMIMRIFEWIFIIHLHLLSWFALTFWDYFTHVVSTCSCNYVWVWVCHINCITG